MHYHSLPSATGKAIQLGPYLPGLPARLSQNSSFLTRRLQTTNKLPPQCRSYSVNENGRLALLSKIYAPFAGLDKKSERYRTLAASGTVWEKWAKPFSIDADLHFQQENQSFLTEIDGLALGTLPALQRLVTMLMAEAAQQSVAIEGSPLKLADSELILRALNEKGIMTLDGLEMGSEGVQLPEAAELLPNASSLHTIELRNQLIVAQSVATRALTSEAP